MIVHLIVTAIGMVAAMSGFAQTPERVPYIDDFGQLSYGSYRSAKPNNAFAISEGGGYGQGFEASTPEAAIRNAIQFCARRDPVRPCRVYSLNGHVVWGMTPEEAVRHVASQRAQATGQAIQAAPSAETVQTAQVGQAAGRVPHIDDRGQRYFRETFQQQGLHRAMAIGPGNRWYAWVGASSVEEAKKRALEGCTKQATPPCALYAVNGYVVWGRDGDTIPRYAEAPKLGRFIPSDYLPVRGPQAAPGVVVWSHGYYRGIDATVGMPHAYVNRFHAAGWDVYRYNHQWVDQLSADIEGLIESVNAAKAAGYKKVVLVGQSQGAWISMEALARGVKADAVISTAMARHGAPPNSNARSDFRQLMRDIKTRGATDIPVVLTLFDKDDYDPGGRFADVKDILKGSNVPLYFIEHPADLPGHGAGSSSKFNDRFGACIVRFVTSSPPTPGECK